MPKCPVCNTEIKSTKQCSNCGFDQIKEEFLTEEDYHHWIDDTVAPCKVVYKEQLKVIDKLKKQVYELKKNQIHKGKSLYEFFSNNGFEVIDKRCAGGCLWVVGSKTKLEPYIKEAKKYFKIGDNGFSSGKSTSNRMGWYTNSNE